MTIKLKRIQSDHKRTFGEWTHPDGWSCWILENPWQGNEQTVSCIPDGTYRLEYRDSPLINRITKGKFTGGYELVDVPGRTFIMIHHGNWVSNTDGCPLTGEKPTMILGELGVPNSMNTFIEIMSRLDAMSDEERVVEITWELDEGEPRFKEHE